MKVLKNYKIKFKMAAAIYFIFCVLKLHNQFSLNLIGMYVLQPHVLWQYNNFQNQIQNGRRHIFYLFMLQLFNQFSLNLAFMFYNPMRLLWRYNNFQNQIQNGRRHIFYLFMLQLLNQFSLNLAWMFYNPIRVLWQYSNYIVHWPLKLKKEVYREIKKKN